ncbi:MAG: serine/threonine protein kinase [Rhodanobacteraceae bacterium]|nr:serine/threonine protein kinase [Rhodanobacteraceae bacterium]
MNEHSVHDAELDALLLRLLRLDEGEERDQFLAELLATRPAVHARLLQWLELSERPIGMLQTAKTDRAEALAALGDQAATKGEYCGQRIGAWRLLRQVGRGGMGSVYEVAREDGAFVQKAALKLIRSDYAAADFLARFGLERQILATLNHPGIAHLLDGGETAEGHPYLVMEFVEGLRIDAWCDERQLDLDSRLALFLQVAEAVDHAHARRVVHRDLKPSNIAVTAEGTVKLLDFGIGKVLDSEDVRERHERTATRLFTPDYATPEQVTGQPAGMPSDIYQLGLLLYELVCGQHAQQPSDITQASLERAVCGDDPPLPSVVAALVPPPTAARIGGLAPAALARRLRGDLDLIIMKALRKEPARRYASARDFIDDLQRWQHHRPVLARPETWGYRAARFVRRHAWAVAASTVIFLLTAAYALTVSLQARAITLQRDRAQAEAQKADRVKSLILRLFEGADPTRSLGKELTARELLNTGWQSIETELGEQPDVQVELLTTVGATYYQLGQYDDAQKLLLRARDVVAAHPELPAEVRASALRALGALSGAQDKFDEADRLLREAEALYRAGTNHENMEIATTLRDRGQLQYERADYAGAEVLFRESLAMRQRLFGERNLDVADSIGRVGMVLHVRGDYAGAEPLLRQALAVRRELLPPNHPHIASDLSSLAAVERSLGRYQQAEAHYREALAIVMQTRGSDHPFVASVMNNLARALKAQDKNDEAETLLLKALAIRRQHLGEKHSAVAMNLSDLGWVAEGAGKIEAAENYYRQALALYELTHPWRSAAVFNLGSVLEARGQLVAAERQYREALYAQRKHYGDKHELVGIDLLHLGRVVGKQGRRDEAQKLLREALQNYEARVGAEDAQLAPVLMVLEANLHRPAQAAEADALLRRALAIRVKTYGADDARSREVQARIDAAGR